MKWLTQGQLVEQEWTFINADKFNKREAVGDKLVVRWSGCMTTSDKQKKEILSYIKSGGSLLAAVCPWQWLQKNPGRRLNHMDLYNFLKKFHMFYSGQCVRVDGREISVDGNLAAFSNFDRYIIFCRFSNTRGPDEPQRGFSEQREKFGSPYTLKDFPTVKCFKVYNFPKFYFFSEPAVLIFLATVLG